MRDKSEVDISKDLGGNLTRASGATNDDADIRIVGNYLIEVKRRDTVVNIVFDPGHWEKLRKQAIKANKEPIYIFVCKESRYVFGNFNSLDELFKNKAYKRPIRTHAESKVHIAFQDFWDIFTHAHKTNDNRPVICQFFFNNLNIGLTSFIDFEGGLKDGKR